MTTRIEDTDGKRTYYVNDVPYDRIQDIPEEYRSYFADADNNGVPDQFDSLIKIARGKAGFKDIVDTIANELKADREEGEDAEAQPPVVSPQKRYLRDEGRTGSSFPMYIKVLFVLAIGFTVAWFIVTRLPETPDAPVGGDETEEVAPIEESAIEVVPEAEVAEEAMNPNAFRFVVEDPNEPPYKMFVNVFRGSTLLFAFDLPPGAMIETGNERLAIDMEIPQGTNLSAAVFDATILTEQCLDAGVDWTAKYVGATEYQAAIVTDSGAGHTYNTYYYNFNGAYCAQFSLTLRSINAGASGTELREYNPDYLISLIEDVLRTVRFE